MRNFLVGAGLALAALIPSAHANLLVNGSFEADNANIDPDFYLRVTPSGWVAVGDSADIIHNNYLAGNPAILVDAQHGFQFLDLNQLSFLGGVAQIVNVTAGERYRLSLWSTAWADNGTGDIAYRLFNPANNAILAQGSAHAAEGQPWLNYTLEAVAISGQIGVEIRTTLAEQAGPGLDNVDLDIVGASAVPEPGTTALLAAGALAALAVRCRKR